MLFTALSESKHQLLQKMAGTLDRPASKQIEVRCDATHGMMLKHVTETPAFVVRLKKTLKIVLLL